jgi:hypothetical protein
VRRQPVAPTMLLLVLGVAVWTDVPPPVDRVWTDVDPNAIPLNPVWSGQAVDQALKIPAACATQKPFFESKTCTSGKEPISLDLANDSFSICNATWKNPLRGHVNWAPATFTGSIRWGERTDDLLDHEYCLEMLTPRLRGLTEANHGTLHLEFDVKETINKFNTKWWDALRDKVDILDTFDNDARRKDVTDLLDDHDAIVVGLMGLDCQHECQTELHPVYGMAIHANSIDPADDVWAVFARNWGNEGQCSRFDHPIDIRSMKFRIPWRTNAASVKITDSAGDDAKTTKFCQSFQGVVDVRVTSMTNLGAELAVALPDPKEKPRVAGELHLTWLDANHQPLLGAPSESALSWPSTRPWLAEPDPEHRLKDAARARRRSEDRQEELFGAKDNVCTTTVPVSQVTPPVATPERALRAPRLLKPTTRPEKKDEENRQKAMFESLLKGK